MDTVILIAGLLIIVPAAILTVAVFIFGPRKVRYQAAEIAAATEDYNQRSDAGDPLTVMTADETEDAIP